MTGYGKTVPVKPGDRVKWKAVFLKSTGQRGRKPGTVLEDDPTTSQDWRETYVRVQWDDYPSGETSWVNRGNILPCKKPDYTGI